MKTDHIAIWTKNLEQFKQFYIRYFNVECSSKCVNEKRGFESYFLRFDSGARVEVMYLPSLLRLEESGVLFIGYAHIAIGVDLKENVDDLTTRLQADRYTLLSGPRYTGTDTMRVCF